MRELLARSLVGNESAANATSHGVRNVGHAAVVSLKKAVPEMDERAPYRMAFVLFVIGMIVGCYCLYGYYKNRLRSSRVRRYDHLETEELTTEFLGDSSDSDGEFDDILLHK